MMRTLTLQRVDAVDAATATHAPADRRPVLRLVGDGTTRVIRALVADGHELVRVGFRLLLEDEEDVTVTAEAGTGEEAVDLARRTRPDVVVIDSGLPGLDVLEATRRILAQSPHGGVSVLLLSADESGESVLRALRAGARGLLVKDSEPSELLRALRVVARGDALLSPSLTRLLIARCVDGACPSSTPASSVTSGFKPTA
jgi:DNA-binding NarL/FixJ family response regulator